MIRTHSRTARLLVVLALATLGACASMESKEKMVRLEETVKVYTSAVRWGDFGTAASLVKPRDAAAAPVDGARLEGVRVMSHDYRIEAPDAEASEAWMTARFEYSAPSSARVRTVTQRAMWYWDEASGAWYLDGSLPEF
ncbi:MAG: hypothetical protein H6983_03810 [Ectothiorhodospiraceae bacterium]|nr:hypothetical protein [Chromatiales bacterium]MCP5153267.1 hypothetical protein [Ectothiorhodospiraceae bacterium]